MAASTRVERIQYKEIPTPGWRSVGLGNNGLPDSGEVWPIFFSFFFSVPKKN